MKSTMKSSRLDVDGYGVLPDLSPPSSIVLITDYGLGLSASKMFPFLLLWIPILCGYRVPKPTLSFPFTLFPRFKPRSTRTSYEGLLMATSPLKSSPYSSHHQRQTVLTSLIPKPFYSGTRVGGRVCFSFSFSFCSRALIF